MTSTVFAGPHLEISGDRGDALSICPRVSDPSLKTTQRRWCRWIDSGDSCGDFRSDRNFGNAWARTVASKTTKVAPDSPETRVDGSDTSPESEETAQTPAVGPIYLCLPSDVSQPVPGRASLVQAVESRQQHLGSDGAAAVARLKGQQSTERRCCVGRLMLWDVGETFIIM